MKLRFRLKYNIRKFLVRDVAVSIGILFFSTIISIFFHYIGFSQATLVMVYLLGVILVSLRTNWIFGTSASVLSVFLFNFFFIEPLYTIVVYDPENLFTFAVMLTVSLITGFLTAKVKEQGEKASEREQRTNVLYSLGSALLKVNGTTEVIKTALKQIRETLPGTAALHFRNSTGRIDRYAYYEDDGVCRFDIRESGINDPVQWTLETGNPCGNGSDRYGELPALHLPITGIDGINGVFVYYPEHDERLNHEERSLIETAAAQLTLAMERELISERHNAIKLRAENERIRATFLRSISHDLRTPLASITGASSTLMENGSEIDEDMKKELLSGIYEESTWLSELVDNLLSLSRIQSSDGMIRKTPEVLDDVLVSAVQRIQKRLGKHRLTVEAPEDLLLVPMDGKLIEQVLINLIDNAVRHTPDGTNITVRAALKPDEPYALFTVRDDGPGIGSEEFETLFEPYRDGLGGHPRNTRGTGLGLSICKTIVETHGGVITAANVPGGGAQFEFTLPAPETRKSDEKATEV